MEDDEEEEIGLIRYDLAFIYVYLCLKDLKIELVLPENGCER